jgi:hypothetical protein
MKDLSHPSSYDFQRKRKKFPVVFSKRNYEVEISLKSDTKRHKARLVAGVNVSSILPLSSKQIITQNFNSCSLSK